VSMDGRVEVSPDKRHWPAVCVTSYGADAYCQAQGKRLPTMSEWEFAARESREPFLWRREWSDQLLGYRNAQRPHNAGSSPQGANPFGVLNMVGNVAEWVKSGLDISERRMSLWGDWTSHDPCQLIGLTCRGASGDLFATDVGFRCAASAPK
jgi:formylglycine-generating enzyme required for sulfatase activity